MKDVYEIARERVERYEREGWPVGFTMQEAFSRYFPADDFRTAMPSDAMEVE
jgi:hypothetical protein